jgi:hypothetical protein
VVRAREEERGGVHGDAGGLPSFYRSEERKGRRSGGGGASAMAGGRHEWWWSRWSGGFGKGRRGGASVCGCALNAPLSGEGKGHGRPGRAPGWWCGPAMARGWGRPEVGDAPDRWVPPVDVRERGRREGGPREVNGPIA